MGLTPAYWTPDEYRGRLLWPLGEVMMAMERTGAVVDRDRLASIGQRARAEEVRLRGELDAWVGRDVNWGSWVQLRGLFHGDGGLGMAPSPHCKQGEVDIAGGEVSTDDRALEWLAGEYPEHRAGLQGLRDLRRAKRCGDYAESWNAIALDHPDGTSRLHPSFGLGSDADSRPGAKTGRFACKNTGAGSLNQVPKVGESLAGELRSAFVAPPGMRLVVRDYSQLEIVELAHITRNWFGPGALSDRVIAGGDIHGPVARTAFGVLGGDAEVAAAADGDFKSVPRLKLLRNLAKIVIYGKNYGKAQKGASESIYLPDGSPLGWDRAGLLYSGLSAQFPETDAYQAGVREHITQHGSITSLFGRLMWLPGAKAQRQGERNRAARQAYNYPLQAGGQEIMALALIGVAGDPVLRSLGFVLSLVVHDEVVGWAPEENAEAAAIRLGEVMEQVVTLRCPLRTEGHTGANWAEAK